MAQLLPARVRDALFLRSQQRTGRYLEPGAVVEATLRTPDGAIDPGTQRNQVVQGAPPP